jgi:hypothetical protein
MHICARVSKTDSDHAVEIATDGRWQSIAIARKAIGREFQHQRRGTLVSPLEATGFCNDLHRRTRFRQIDDGPDEFRAHRARFSMPGRSTVRMPVRLYISPFAMSIAHGLHATDFEKAPLCGCIPPGHHRFDAMAAIICRSRSRLSRVAT